MNSLCGETSSTVSVSNDSGRFLRADVEDRRRSLIVKIGALDVRRKSWSCYWVFHFRKNSTQADDVIRFAVDQRHFLVYIFLIKYHV